MDNKYDNKDKLCNIIIEGRKKISISGVEDVDSFDEDNIILYTVMGTLVISGHNFHINKLNVDTGELIIEGEYDSSKFDDGYSGKSKGGFWAKMFK